MNLFSNRTQQQQQQKSYNVLLKIELRYNVHRRQVDPEKLKERFPIIQLFTFEWIIDTIWLIYRGRP